MTPVSEIINLQPAPPAANVNAPLKHCALCGRSEVDAILDAASDDKPTTSLIEMTQTENGALCPKCLSEDKPADGLTDAQRRLVELDLRKPEIKAYYEELEQTVAAVAAEVGVDGYFAAPDGTVYKIVKPEGQFVTYKQLDFHRTKRDGETKGTLSMKEAADARANRFRPLTMW
jgi:hypothetical protein